MRLYPINFHPDFVSPIIENLKCFTFRPLKPTPERIDHFTNHVLYGSSEFDGIKIPMDSMGCHYGNEGDGLLMFCDGNNIPFAVRKISSVKIMKLSEAKLAFNQDREIGAGFPVWNDLYSETEYSEELDPIIYIITWVA